MATYIMHVAVILCLIHEKEEEHLSVILCLIHEKEEEHLSVILCLIHEKEEEHLSVILCLIHEKGRTFISNFFDIISINKLTDTENYLSVWYRGHSDVTNKNNNVCSWRFWHTLSLVSQLDLFELLKAVSIC